MDKKAMLKQAATILREQQIELRELHEEQSRNKIAEQIVRKLIENDELLAESVLSKLSELRAKPVEELQIMEKAAEMFRSSMSSSFGKLSTATDYSSNPLLDYLFSDV